MPTAIRLEGVAFSHRGDHDLLCDIHLHLRPGWTGIVGANGVGKSTLLALLAGTLSPTRGRIQREPAALGVVMCPQRVHACGPDVRQLATDDRGLARGLRGRLGLDPDDLDRWPSLSPGERRRWQLAGVLARQPQALLLDEPTNHLDAESRAQITAVLASFRGVGVVVSHDRSLLEALTTSTIRVAGGSARAWPGAYDQARSAWEAERDHDNTTLVRDRGRAARLHRRLADTRREQAQTQAAIGARSRTKGPRDHDGRSVNRRERAAKAASRSARRASVVRATAGRAHAALEGRHYQQERGAEIRFEHEAPTRRPLLRLCVDELRAGPTRCTGRLALSLEPGSRVWIRGPNGAGKTTLLRALAAASTLPPSRLFHLPQVLPPATGETLMAELRAAPPDQRGRTLQRVAALGVDPGPLLGSASPSAGELRKLALAHGLAQPSWVLLLDEPTHHLDLPSVERLESALAEYPGALVLVSHDERFASGCTHERWTLGDGQLSSA